MEIELSEEPLETIGMVSSIKSVGINEGNNEI